jgi:hypothetical protein
MKLLVLLLSLFSLVLVASARAEVDCNEKCGCKFGFCEPACKLKCEVDKKAARDLGLPQPPGLPGLGDIEKALTQSCASGFELINKFVIVSQGSYAAGSERLLNQAQAVLIGAGVIPEQEFNNVSIRWARLKAQGQAPDAGVVLISEEHINNPQRLFIVSSILAHEMMHQRQYVRVGTDKFKCAYSREYIRTNGNQSTGNSWEQEAYVFQDRANAMIQQYMQTAGAGGPQGPGGQAVCVTQYITCAWQAAPRGSGCQCQAPAGYPVPGRVQ